MPELPEVETVRRVLEERLVGRTVTGIDVPPITFYRPPPHTALADLAGLKVTGFRRRGKYLIMGLTQGRDLVFHLGMSGSLSFTTDPRHTRFSISFGSDSLYFIDPRRFGRVGCPLPELGPEPLDKGFDRGYLYGELRGRKAPVKALLMDQRVVAGIGNIYATEALFEAGLRPSRAGGRVSGPAAGRLVAAVKEVLSRGVALRGSTLDDEAYLDPLGRPGSAQNHLKVYGRTTGACGHPLIATRKRISGRTSLYCPRCQK